ncbi:MAG TPA: DUF192 domain-containing protein [Dehalococcoidia bacterium]|nr:DUF192 domain-containing protein [Dehalococcoidia bacterium]
MKHPAIAVWAIPAILFAVASCRVSVPQGSSGASHPISRQIASGDASQPLGPNLVTLTFVSPSGAQAALHVRVEATEPMREQGLMNITSLPEDEGDLFVWQDAFPNQDVYSPFWMKDTKIPLSIAFITADGHVMEEQDMAADTTTYHIPRLPYRFAIEANLGWYDRHSMPAGSQVSLPGSLLPPAPSPPPPPQFGTPVP